MIGPWKKKNSLGGAAAPVAAVSSVTGVAKLKKKGKKSLGIPARTTPIIEFKSTLPPNLVGHEFQRSRKKLPRWDYWLVLGGLLFGCFCVVQNALDVKTVLAKKAIAEQASKQATAKAEERGRLDKDSSALSKKHYESQRLFLPAQTRFLLSDFLFNAAKGLPREFFMAELSGRFEPEFYLSGKRLTTKNLDRVDSFVGSYNISMKVQGLGKDGTSEKIDPFLRAFDPPASIANTSGGMQEGTAFQLDYFYSPLVQFHLPGQGALSGTPVDPPVPPRLTLNSFRR